VRDRSARILLTGCVSILTWLGIVLGLVGNVWMALADITVAGWIAGNAVRMARRGDI
jgi:hypothetical protein